MRADSLIKFCGFLCPGASRIRKPMKNNVVGVLPTAVPRMCGKHHIFLTQQYSLHSDWATSLLKYNRDSFDKLCINIVIGMN